MAAAAAKNTLEAEQSRLGVNHPDLIEPLAWRSRLQLYSGHIQSSAKFAQHAMGLARGLAKDDPRRIAAHVSWAHLLLGMTRVDEAYGMLVDVMSGLSRPGYEFENVHVVTLMAACKMMSGNFGEARDLMLAGQALVERWFPVDEHLFFEVCSVFPLSLEGLQGRGAKALPKALECENRWRAAKYPNSYARASFLSVLASFHFDARKIQGGFDYGEQSAKAWQMLIGPYVTDMVPMYILMAQAAASSGDLTRAGRYQAEAEKIARFNAVN